MNHFVLNGPEPLALRFIPFGPTLRVDVSVISTPDGATAAAEKASEMIAAGLENVAVPTPSLHRFRSLARELTAVEREQAQLAEQIAEIDRRRQSDDLLSAPGFSKALARLSRERAAAEGKLADAQARQAAVEPLLDAARASAEADLAQQARLRTDGACRHLLALRETQVRLLLASLSDHLVELRGLDEAVRLLRAGGVGAGAIKLLDALSAEDEESPAEDDDDEDTDAADEDTDAAPTTAAEEQTDAPQSDLQAHATQGSEAETCLTPNLEPESTPALNIDGGPSVLVNAVNHPVDDATTTGRKKPKYPWQQTAARSLQALDATAPVSTAA